MVYILVFWGDNRHKQCSNSLKKIMEEEYKDEIERYFEIRVENPAAPSCSKGTFAYISPGSNCASLQGVTYLYAVWTKGVMCDTYLKYNSAIDQFVGRILSGPSFCTIKFTILLPQFDHCDKDTCSALVKRFFTSILLHIYFMSNYFHILDCITPLY